MQTSPPNSSTEQKHDSRGVLPTPVPPPQTEATNEKRTRSPSRGASTSDEVESSGSGSLLTRTASTSPPPSSKSSGKPLESLESVPSSTSMKPSHSMPFYASPPVSLNDSNNTASAPGDWNHQHLTVNPPAAGTSTSSGNDTTYRKPPRFRSKSRSPMAASMSFTNPISPPVSDGISTPYGAAASSSAAVNSDTAVSFTYPTLNSPPAPSISPLPVPSSLSTAQPRRTPTPRRAPTPSHTPPPSGGLASGSVSTQTQIASMRGALEAARMREEKSRLEAEKWAKECEMVRWRWGEDVGVWRRKEAEYQAHIHYLMHHMQILAMAPSQPPSASSLSPVQSTSQPQTSSRSTSSQSHPPSPMPSSRSSGPTPSPNIFPPQSQFHLHMSPPVHSPVLPPFGPSSSTGYAASPSLQQQSMFSLFFPSAPSPAPNPFSSVPSSVSGTPSTGSRSPAADFISPYNRGRRPTRDGMEDAGWVTGREAGDPNGHRASDADGAQASETDDNEQFNDVLADAILKRPGSIRVRSERSSASASAVQSPTTADEKEKRLPPFTFPSLSNAGYVEKEFAGEDEGEGDDLASNALPESSVGVDSDTSPYIEGARPAG
ncbi:hypothetical protein PLICRDRAFT_311819 [Plicaturopsis crispa FD-325 SS-3]|nr:hypothetical protein PLICRDRAFT_311819 [Plicaturopsis crispa FD-325 SS-3]